MAGGGRGGGPGRRRPVAVVGGGVAGLAAAGGLARAGVPCVVLERAGGPAGGRAGGAALGLWGNAFRALEALGAADALRAAQPLRLRRVQLCSAARAGPSGPGLLREFSFAECGDPDHEFRGVRRPALLAALEASLLEGAAGGGGGGAGRSGLAEVRSGQAVAGVRPLGGGDGGVEVLGEDGAVLLEAACAVGCDGAGSRVARDVLGVRPSFPPPGAGAGAGTGAGGASTTRYAGYAAYRGVARAAPGGLSLPPDAIRQVWGRGVRAGLYPVSEEEVYWFVCFNAGEAELGGLSAAGGAARRADALARVAGWPGALGVEAAVAATAGDDVSFSPIRDRLWAGARDLGTLAGGAGGLPAGLGGGPPAAGGLVTLAGDALHPMTPNLGQGACCALEDAVVLAREVSGAWNAGGDLPGALRRYESQRARRCLPLVLRSHAMGVALQLPAAGVCAARDAFIERAFSPAHFLDHTAFDCGSVA